MNITGLLRNLISFDFYFCGKPGFEPGTPQQRAFYHWNYLPKFDAS